MTSPKPDKPEETGRERSAARLAAVQALYEMDMVGAKANSVLEEFLLNRWRKADSSETSLRDSDGNPENAAEPLVEPDKEWLSELVHGVTKRHLELDSLIEPALKGDLTLERLESLIRVILRAGAYELSTKRNIPAAVVINEYLDVAHAFFEGNEPNLVNGVLDKVAHEIRKD
ncbi:MAG: transcription antitermination factor NusB [Rhodospirillales bacterium]|nr:transcription antitermination factor NusB [Rhodospirillales bacterium]